MKNVKRNYKTLTGFWIAWKKWHSYSNFCNFTLSDYLRGYFPVFANGKYMQIHFNLSDAAKNELFDLFASGFTSSKSTRDKYAFVIREYIGKSYGIFERVWITKRDGKFYGTYCAGQDYISETRTVQKLLRDGSMWDCK